MSEDKSIWDELTEAKSSSGSYKGKHFILIQEGGKEQETYWCVYCPLLNFDGAAINGETRAEALGWFEQKLGALVVLFGEAKLLKSPGVEEIVEELAQLHRKLRETQHRLTVLELQVRPRWAPPVSTMKREQDEPRCKCGETRDLSSVDNGITFAWRCPVCR